MTYATIMADPPWLERGSGKCKRGADKHYPLLHTRDIPGVMQASPLWQPADDCHLYLWVTSNHLPSGLEVMRALGFRYVSQFAWVKAREGVRVQVGIGQYFRGQHELCLFGVRGDGYAVRTDARNVGSVIIAPRTRHSQKPEAAYELIERRSKGPRLEMFARTKRGGWDAWGNAIKEQCV